MDTLRGNAAWLAGARVGPVLRVLATLAQVLAETRPYGARNRQARATVMRVAAVLLTSGDWRSGARCHPGLAVLAEMAKVSTETVRRACLVLEGTGLFHRGVIGELLGPAAREAAAVADPYDRERWADAAEWYAHDPHTAPEAHLSAARAVLAEIADGARPLRRAATGTRVIRPAGKVVDPSVGKALSPYVPARTNGSRFLRPDGRRQSGAASRPSPGRAGPGGRTGHSGRRTPSRGLRLARELVASGRIPMLRHEPMYMIAQVLATRGHWTVDDVMRGLDQRLSVAGYTVPKVIERGVSYLRWALAGTDPATPPAQAERAAAAAHGAALRKRQAQHRADHAARAEAAAPADSPGRIAARAEANRARLAAAHHRSEADQRERDNLAAALTAQAARSPYHCPAGHPRPGPGRPCPECADWLDGDATHRHLATPTGGISTR